MYVNETYQHRWELVALSRIKSMCSLSAATPSIMTSMVSLSTSQDGKVAQIEGSILAFTPFFLEGVLMARDAKIIRRCSPAVKHSRKWNSSPHTKGYQYSRSLCGIMKSKFGVHVDYNLDVALSPFEFAGGQELYNFVRKNGPTINSREIVQWVENMVSTRKGTEVPTKGMVSFSCPSQSYARVDAGLLYNDLWALSESNVERTFYTTLMVHPETTMKNLLNINSQKILRWPWLEQISIVEGDPLFELYDEASGNEVTRAFRSEAFTTFTTFMSFPTSALPPTWAGQPQKIDLLCLFARLNRSSYCSLPQPANRHHLASPRQVTNLP